MGTTENIILRELASRRSVWLPDVGTLWVERVGATLLHKGNMRPPRNMVRFSSSQKEGAADIRTLIESRGGDGEKEYAAFLERSRTQRGLAIEGGGELRSGTFFPSPELGRLIDPSDASPLRLRRRRGTRIPMLAACLLVLLAAGVSWWYFGCGGAMPGFLQKGGKGSGAMIAAGTETGSGADAHADRTAQADPTDSEDAEESPMNTDPSAKHGEQTGETTGAVEVTETTDSADRAETAPAGDVQPATGTQPAGQSGGEDGIKASGEAGGKTITEGGGKTVTEAGGKTAVDAAPIPKSQTATSSRRYYVVGGVFSVDANAEKYIRQTTAAFPGAVLKFEKIPYGNKVLVALFSSDGEAEAADAMRRLSSSLSRSDLWIYSRRTK